MEYHKKAHPFYYVLVRIVILSLIVLKLDKQYHYMGRTKVSLKEYRIFLFLCALMVVNLIYMHYEVFIKNYIATAYCRSLFFCVVDVMLTVLFFHILTLGKRKVTFILSYCTLLFFATANILYSRFFSQYITFSVLAECHNLRGNW